MPLKHAEAKISAAKILWAVCAVALLVRLMTVAAWIGAGYKDRLSGDSYHYHQMAQSLVEGRGFSIAGEPSARRGPVYPLFLAPFLKSGAFPTGVQIFQAFLGVLNCLLIFFTAKFLFSEKVGLLAAGLYSLDYLLIKQTVYVLPEILLISLVLYAIYGLVRARAKGEIRWAIFSGVAAAITVLAKESFIYFFPLAALSFWLIKQNWKIRASLFIFFLVSFVLVLAPWAVRNWIVFDGKFLLSANGGKAFYLGNNPTASLRIHGGDWINEDDTDYPKDDPNLPPLETVEADRYLMKKGLEFVRENPVRFLELFGIKAVRLWFPYYSKAQPWAKWAMAVPYVLILGLGLWGMAASRKRAAELLPILLLILYVTFIHSVTIPGIRYRYPVMPFLMMFAAFQALRLWDRIRAFP